MTLTTKYTQEDIVRALQDAGVNIPPENRGTVGKAIAKSLGLAYDAGEPEPGSLHIVKITGEAAFVDDDGHVIVIRADGTQFVAPLTFDLTPAQLVPVESRP